MQSGIYDFTVTAIVMINMQEILNVRTKVLKVLNNRKIFLLVTSFCCLQVRFFRSKGKCLLKKHFPLDLKKWTCKH